METPMSLTLKLSDEQATVFKQKPPPRACPSMNGYKNWLNLSRLLSGLSKLRQDIILASMREVPPEMMATMPTDGASQHDHYIYGWPKREV
jgi:hypothetical protein